MSDVSQFKKALGGLADPYDTDTTPTVAEGGPVDQLTDSVVMERLPADGATGTVIALTKLYVNVYNFPMRIVRFGVSADADVAVAASTSGSILLLTDDGANSAPAQAAAVANDTPGGAWSADVLKVGTLTDANCLLQPGACLFYQQTKASTGTQFPARTIVARLRRA